MTVYIELEKCANLEWLDEEYETFGISYYITPFWLKIRHKDNIGTEKRSCNVIKIIYNYSDNKITQAFLGLICEDTKQYASNFEIELPKDNHIPVHSGIKITDDVLKSL